MLPNYFKDKIVAHQRELAVARQCPDHAENDAREILTQGLMFEPALVIRRRKESANRGPANPNLHRDLPLGQALTEEFLDLLKV